MAKYRSSIAKRRKNKFGKFLSFTLILSIIILFSTIITSLFNKRAFPIIVEIALNEEQTNINILLSETLSKITKDMNFESADFYTKTVDNTGKIDSFSANTILINEICAKFASELSKELSNNNTRSVKVPIGSLFGIESFSNFGPSISAKIMPKGNVTVDYETSFISAGINQTNFQVWLNIESTVQIINPVQQENITINRKITLVNSIINGEVPSSYINTK